MAGSMEPSGERKPTATRIPFGIKALLVSKVFITMATVGQVTILGFQVFDITGRALDLGLLGLAEFLPTALLAPIAGSVADRYDRRVVAGIALLGEAVVSLLLFGYATTDPSAVAPIFLLVIAFASFRAFVAPATRALPVDLAPPGTLERVIALSAVAWQAGLIVGPVAAGFLYVVDPSLPYLAAAGVLVLSVVALAFVPATTVERLVSSPGVRAALRDALDGLRFIRRTPTLFGAISLDLFAVLFGGAVALLPAIADERLGVGAVGLGWLRAAVGIGAALTSLALAARPITRRVGPILFVTVAAFGVATIVLGLTTNYVVAFVSLLILAGADAVSVFIRSTIVPLATPESMRGRVLATENVFIGASNELGAFESGVAAQLVGLVGAVVLGGVGTLVVVAVWWQLFPSLRHIDRFAEVQPAPDPEAIDTS